MGKRQNALADILIDAGVIVLAPVKINKELFYNCPYHETIKEVYLTLGGILDEYPVNVGSFDIILDKCFIELDEENHFNRYRKLTLQSSIYSDFSFFPVADFIDYCDLFEDKVRDYGKFWTTNTSEKQFGKSSAPGDFSGNGSARWKQRAFYDFLKDIYSLLQNRPVYRFSIYETIEKESLNKILKKSIIKENIQKFIQNRIS